MNWNRVLTSSEKEMLTAMGISYLPSGYNAVVEAMKNEQLVQRMNATYDKLFGYDRIAKLATLNQMAVYDAQYGPDKDGSQVALRRQWYAWFKLFAITFSKNMGQDINSSNWSTDWAGRMSRVYADLVRDEHCTYENLWIIDGSRKTKSVYERLINNLHLLIVVEKDSLFVDYEKLADSIGAAVLAGGGKNAYAASELVLRKHFYWTEWNDPFTEEDPLHLFVISDYDYDGRLVINNTFETQLKRYTPHVITHRVGLEVALMSQEGLSLEDRYQLKMSNKAYVDWANENGLFEGYCVDCGEDGYCIGHPFETASVCPNCGGCMTTYEPYIESKDGMAYGMEVEAVPKIQYYEWMAKLLIEVVGWEFLLERLRIETLPYLDEAVEKARNNIAFRNARFAEIQKQINELIDLRDEKFLRPLELALKEKAIDMQYNYEDIGDDPTEDEFISYCRNANHNYQVWRPFSRAERTEELTKDLINDKDIATEFDNLTF